MTTDKKELPQLDYPGHNPDAERRCDSCGGLKYVMTISGARHCPACQGTGLKEKYRGTQG